MIALAEPIDADVLRVRNEFLTRPGLHASADAVARFVDVTPRHAAVILDSLVHEDFLERNADGEYVHRHLKEAVVTRSIACALILVGCVAARAAAQDAKIARGAQVYAEQKCALCHSIGDKGNKKGPLDEVGSTRSLEDLRAWVVDAKGMTVKTKAPRKPDMKNYALPKEDLDALVAYMASLKKK
jgi:mono/diheme cytochrome c family protein